VNVTLSDRNTILRADVTGRISCKCKLSGMPECKLGMNDKLLMQKDISKGLNKKGERGISIDDVKFH